MGPRWIERLLRCKLTSVAQSGRRLVPAGTFNVDENGNAVIEVKGVSTASQPEKFAVTIEKAGASGSLFISGAKQPRASQRA